MMKLLMAVTKTIIGAKNAPNLELKYQRNNKSGITGIGKRESKQ